MDNITDNETRKSLLSEKLKRNQLKNERNRIIEQINKLGCKIIVEDSFQDIDLSNEVVNKILNIIDLKKNNIHIEDRGNNLDDLTRNYNKVMELSNKSVVLFKNLDVSSGRISFSEELLSSYLEKTRSKTLNFNSRDVLFFSNSYMYTGAIKIKLSNYWLYYQKLLSLQNGSFQFFVVDPNLEFGICIEEMEYYLISTSWGLH
jgi:hypothetical protein